MVIPQTILDEVIAHAQAGFPNEACGLLASENGRVVRFYPIRNTAESPVFYEMDSQQLLRTILEIEDRGWDLGIIYHSHTRTRAYPSATDVKLAQYPGALYMIVSLATDPPNFHTFEIEDGGIREVEIEVAEGA